MMAFFNGLDVVPTVGAVLLFFAVVMVVVGVTGWLAEREFLERRLVVSNRSPLAGADASKPISVLLDDGMLKRFEALVTPASDAELTRIRRHLLHAGFRSPSAVRVYYLVKAGLAFGMALLGALLMPLLASGLPLPLLGVLIMVPMVVGYVFPSFWLARRIAYRRLEAERAFPEVLDMLLICVEAGIGLDAASRRVAREIAPLSKVLADELATVNDELYAGKSRAAVFRDFADRLAVTDISAFAAVLRQSDEYGVSIADTLRVYASELRNKRLMRAEEKANMMPIKLALGSIAFTIPPTMLIMAGPSVIMILRSFAGLGGH